MSFQSAPNCAEAVINATISGTALANVLNFYKSSGYDQDDIDALAEAVDDAVGSDYLAILASAVSYNSTLVRGLENTVDLQASVTTNAGAGAVSGATMPNNVSLVATLRTGLTGRSARGRFYTMVMSSASLASQNTLSSTIGTGLSDFLLQVQINALAAGWQLCVLSRYNNLSKRATAIAFAVTDIEVRNLLVDSQRRRLPSGH